MKDVRQRNGITHLTPGKPARPAARTDYRLFATMDMSSVTCTSIITDPSTLLTISSAGVAVRRLLQAVHAVGQSMPLSIIPSEAKTKAAGLVSLTRRTPVSSKPSTVPVASMSRKPSSRR